MNSVMFSSTHFAMFPMRVCTSQSRSQGMSVHHLQPMMPHHGGGNGGNGYDGGFALDVSKAYVSPYSQKHKGKE